MRQTPHSLTQWWQDVLCWFDTEAGQSNADPGLNRKVNRMRCIPFFALHALCLGAIFTGVSLAAVVVCMSLYFIRMFAITAFYHRYFAHKSFRTSRGWQFFFAALGNSAAQRGPLWWAAHHRKHHKHSDSHEDLHSPVAHGFWFSHVGWFTCNEGFSTDHEAVKDWAQYPELRWLNRFDMVAPAILAMMTWVLGAVLEAHQPQWGTNGAQMFVWGFCISTVLLFHGTFTINSLGHVWGRRRFKTRDQSRNNLLLALLTLGEGWHNNHHRFAASARQGFYWWEIDLTYYLLLGLRQLGIVTDLKPVPSKVLAEGRARNHE